MNVHTYESLYLGNGTSDHRNEKTKTLCNTKYPPKPRKTHLRNHFWPLESGFSAIATYKTYVFSKSPNVPILKFFLVIPDTFPIPKSLTEVVEDFFSLKTRSRPMWGFKEVWSSLEECTWELQNVLWTFLVLHLILVLYTHETVKFITQETCYQRKTLQCIGIVYHEMCMGASVHIKATHFTHI